MTAKKQDAASLAYDVAESAVSTFHLIYGDNKEPEHVAVVVELDDLRFTIGRPEEPASIFRSLTEQRDG